MKVVWFLAQYAAPIEYGFGTAHHYIAAGLNKFGYKTCIYSCSYNHDMHKTPVLKGLYKYEQINGVDFCWIKGLTYKKASSFKRVLNWFFFSTLLPFVKKNNRPDIIIVSSQQLIPILNAVFYKLIYRCKIVVEIRDIWPMTLIEVGKKSKFNPLILLIGFCEWMAYKFSDVIVSTLPNLSEHIHKRGVHKFDFRFIPQGFDQTYISFQTELDDFFIKNYFSEHKFTIAYAGAIGASNPLTTLIDAAKILEKENHNIQILILGDGEYFDQFKTYSAGLSNVKMIKKIPKKYVQSFLQKCDLLYDCTLPLNIYKYGLSRRKWIDYMLAAKPMVVSYNGYQSIINEAQCGSFVPANDPELLKQTFLTYYHMEKTEIDRIGQGGLDFVHKYHSFETICRTWEILLREI